MRISDWSSDVCSSDLQRHVADVHPADVATELVQRHGLLEARLDHQPADEIHAEGQPARGDQRVTDEELAEIQAMHYEMMACFSRRDLSGYYRLNARIHSAINNAARNPVLVGTYRSINARVQSLRFRTNQNETKWQLAMKEHERMLEALAAHEIGSASGRERVWQYV